MRRRINPHRDPRSKLTKEQAQADDYMLKIDLYSVITWLPIYEIDYRIRHPNSQRALPFKCYIVGGLQMVKRKDVEAYVKQHKENKWYQFIWNWTEIKRSYVKLRNRQSRSTA